MTLLFENLPSADPPISKGKCRQNRIHNIILLGIAIFGVLCCIASIILLSNYITYDGYEIVEDYTDCRSKDTQKCKDSLNATWKECFCYIPINITVPMKAPVTAFYELDSYDQIINRYSQSRDDNQLAGHLSLKPSDNCGSYTYANTTEGVKPIAPCGELADAMFNDTFSFQTNNTYVYKFRTGLISKADKEAFRNPPGNLTEAFKGFSKPINWRKNVWELDTKIPENNGFQNEAFIVWMKTNLKRKPVWRVNHTKWYEHGVPAAVYTLRVIYGYPSSRYDGRRKFILSSVHEIENSLKYGFGVALLVIGLPCIILAGVVLWVRRRTITWRE